MRGVVVLHGTGVLAYLLPANQVGVVHLVVVADSRFERRPVYWCSHECVQLFYRHVR
ncbi:Uncharacterised protein [Mycobacteroides abscessus subsp. abscessus]|nr:Uncharacterised protein [Mycobacteroides abscessus subsp. abscessus]